MITKLFNHPHVLHQKPDAEFDIAEQAIGASIDGGGIIVLEQEGRHIVINRKSIPELCRVLRELAKAGEAE